MHKLAAFIRKLQESPVVSAKYCCLHIVHQNIVANPLEVQITNNRLLIPTKTLLCYFLLTKKQEQVFMRNSKLSICTYIWRSKKKLKFLGNWKPLKHFNMEGKKRFSFALNFKILSVYQLIILSPSEQFTPRAHCDTILILGFFILTGKKLNYPGHSLNSALSSIRWNLTSWQGK